MKIIVAIDGTELQVSDCDYVFLSKYNWSRNSKGYYRCSNGGTWNGHKINGKTLHWFVAQLMKLKIPEEFQLDHIDRNKLNNRRSNLRVVSKELQAQNKGEYRNNTSGYVGVCFHKRRIINPWIARIQINSKRKFLGYFKTPEEANEKYQAAKKIRNDNEIKRCQEIQENKL